MEDITKKFGSVFEIVRADTPALLDCALRLRHQVYCVENKYEKPSSCGESIEFDKFDLFSSHSIVRHRLSGHLTANVRLVLPRSEQTGFQFPIQELVPQDTFQKVLGSELDDLSSFAEISRFCVSREFKNCFERLEGVVGSDFADNPQLDMLEGSNQPRAGVSALEVVDVARLLPHITVALFSAIFEMSAEEGVQNWFAVMVRPSRLLG